VLVLSPFELDSTRGNATTALRTAHRLAQAGAEVTVTGPAELAARLEAGTFDALHLVHAGHAARLLAGLPPELDPTRGGAPLAVVLTLGGNDVYEDLDQSPAPGIAGGHVDASWDLFLGADAVVASTHVQVEALAPLRGPGPGVFLAPKYPEVGHGPLVGLAGTPVELALAGDHPVVIWCGALRRQKRPEWLLPIHRGLRRAHPDLVTVHAGPAVEHDDHRALATELAREPGVVRLPLQPTGPEGSIGTLMAACDLVLNTSRTEGVSNFLLEALHEGVPVLATRCPGNRDWLTDQAALFDTPAQAVELGLGLLADDGARRALGERGRRWLERVSDPVREARVLAEAHQHALFARTKRPG
jgi:glycosyltransferase involved in cell wall biosynthesis